MQEEWFVKVISMLAHNWATISEAQGISTIYFVDDHGKLFDRLDYENADIAKKKLLHNGFLLLDLDDLDDRFSVICPRKVSHEAPMVHRQVYSSAEYGEW